MKDLLGQYVLTEAQMNTMLDAIGEQFDLDTDTIGVLHPEEINAGRRHIDVAVASNEKETCFVSFGCSAKKIGKAAWRDPNWYSPFVEVYLKFKAPISEISNDLIGVYDFCIKSACTNNRDDPRAELCLINGYEYLFIDEDEAYHNHAGYWGMFLCPRFKKSVKGVGDVLFYQLIPAYKEELEFVERYSQKGNYHDLCQAIAEHLDDREYFDVSCNPLTEKELDRILASIIE